MNNKDLEILNRNHDVDSAIAAMEKVIEKMHKYNLLVSADLMFGRPEQTLNGKIYKIIVCFVFIRYWLNITLL